MEKLTLDALIARFDPIVHDKLRAAAANPGTTHIVQFRNDLFDSSRFGEMSALRIGPNCTVKTIVEAASVRLGEMVSDMKIAVAYADLVEAISETG